MQTQPDVSVLMAVHNTEAYLQDAIDSVLRQSFANVELVIVDDGSTDGSWRIAERASEQDPRVRCRRRDACGGASAALNDALALASGRYVTRQDGDDISEEGRIAAQVAFLDAHPAHAAVGTQATFIGPAGAAIGESKFPLTDADIQIRLLETMCLVGPTVMARRASIEQAVFRFDPELSSSEDYDFCLRMAEVGKLANLPGAYYRYRQHGASVSQSRRPAQLYRKARALENAVGRRFGARPPAEALRGVARDYFRSAVVAHRLGDRDSVGTSMRRALRTSPELLECDAIVEQVIRRYSPDGSDEGLRFLSSLFDDVLPRTPALVALRRRLEAAQHVRQVLDGQAAGPAAPRHLWSAFRTHPRALLARGLFARLLRALLGRRSADTALRF